MIKNKELSLTSRKLKELEQQSLLFHGSNNFNIKEFEPRLPEGTEPEQGLFNYDKAVFASDNAGSTVLFAVIDRSKFPKEIREGTWSIDWLENNKSFAKIPSKWKSYLEKMKGYVYILSPETFTEKLYGQLKSKTSVKPIKKLIVKLSNFLELGGNIEWTNEK